ncbi:hypothetical protein ABBQ38_008590 [Trebouxia sp. C0009 RCD-2024]
MVPNKREGEVLHPSEQSSKTQGKALAPEHPQLEERDGSPTRNGDKLAAYRKEIYMLNAKLKKRKTSVFSLDAHHLSLFSALMHTISFSLDAHHLSLFSVASTASTISLACLSVLCSTMIETSLLSAFSLDAHHLCLEPVEHSLHLCCSLRQALSALLVSTSDLQQGLQNTTSDLQQGLQNTD